MGEIILTVVSVHKPGRWPARVFFTRRWRNPDGIEFGKSKLRVKALGAFVGDTRGYRHWREIDYIDGKSTDYGSEFPPALAEAIGVSEP